jgi:threonine dehydrogenase-like Zn-dependent dehydrogenase
VREVSLGETVVVGVLGQVTARLLEAAGRRVIGYDPAPAGAEVTTSAELRQRVLSATDGFGADAAIVTAASGGDEAVGEASAVCGKKSRVVVVGDVGLGLRRADLYEKELDVVMSTPYGPGRYDSSYEVEGRDYPIGKVRWTENRNMEEYLRLLAAGSVTLDGLRREDYPVDEAQHAYEALELEGDRPLLVMSSRWTTTRHSGSRAAGRPRGAGVAQDKGHRQELETLALCLRDGEPWPIPLAEQLAAMRVAFRVEEQLR